MVPGPLEQLTKLALARAALADVGDLRGQATARSQNSGVVVMVAMLLAMIVIRTGRAVGDRSGYL
jgi:hypothetical protein